jgi:beta-fructofuranosidase
MAFDRFRPRSHFIAPHSWANDPCGAVYLPETKEYLFCYQWNPGTTEGGNSAWGMARSKDLVTWQDCSPAIRNGIPTSYDSHGVFSGSIVSRVVEGRRVLFLFYTSVSALPIHWSVDYIKGCESQSVAFSTDFGRSWHRYEKNPLLKTPPKRELTTGWRDPFVSPWPGLSKLLNVDPSIDYMMISSGERRRGCQLHIYRSHNLLDWEPVSTILDVQVGSRISPTSKLTFGRNFECASFFTIGQRHYIIVGVEEDADSERYNKRYLLWLSGTLTLEGGKPKFNITSQGLLDHGISYAAHIFRDSEDRILQLGWADETARPDVVRDQGWAGCLPHPRELYEVSRSIDELATDNDAWIIDESTGLMSTLGLHPAPQVQSLRNDKSKSSLTDLRSIQSTNYEIKATFSHLSGQEKFTVNVRESPNAVETTKVILDLESNCIAVDRSRSSKEYLGQTSSDSGHFQLFPGEDLRIQIFVDNSLLEIYANDRFALTSRIYPTLETSVGASYDFGQFGQNNVKFECWEGFQSAWPGRQVNGNAGGVEFSMADLDNLTPRIDSRDLLRQPAVLA